MLIAARNAMMAGKKLSARDYVQDGLVAMWDGIENAGFGKHEDSPAVFVDLVNGYNMNSYGSASSAYSTFFSDNALQGKAYILNANSVPQHLFSTIVGGSRTVEFVFSRESLSTTVGLPVFVSGNWMSIAGFIGSRLLVYHQGNGFYIDPPSDIAPYNTSISLSVDSSMADVYVNGSKVTAVSAGTTATPTSASNMFIGQNLGLVNTTNYFALKTHSIRISNRALTASEIAANYAVDKARFNLP